MATIWEVLLELDGNAQIISYEEYFPYGGTSFVAGQNQKEVKIKKYRYTGKERDGFTSLYYYGARYYASWLGRWLSCDPKVRDCINLYLFVRNNPINNFDPDGKESSASTRFWGGIQALGGAVQMGLGVAGWLAPEPTMLTKVAGTVALVHGADDFSTGIKKLITGENQKTAQNKP